MAVGALGLVCGGPRLLSSLSPLQEQKASKKKELPKELRQDPPILRVLGSGLLALEPLLAGEPLVSSVCNFGVIRTPEIDRLMFLRVQRGPCPSCLHQSSAGQGGAPGADCQTARLLWQAPGGTGSTAQLPAFWVAGSLGSLLGREEPGKGAGQARSSLEGRPCLPGRGAPQDCTGICTAPSQARPDSREPLMLWFFLSGFEEEQES